MCSSNKVKNTELLLPCDQSIPNHMWNEKVFIVQRKKILAIDGPAGAGKSTIARQVADHLGLLYLDTGAMYRALTWLVLEAGIAVDDEITIAKLVSQCHIQLLPSDSSQGSLQVWINNQEVTQVIRSTQITDRVSTIAAQPAVRKELVKQQQRYGNNGGIVAEGRDIGTNVFPDAELKIFLTASVRERARRRQQQLTHGLQNNVDLKKLEQAIYERDLKDSNRTIAPLCKAADAIELKTDNLSIAEVTDQVVKLYYEKIDALS
jgi:pantoate ligase / CMP/dCMP kinase